jgi:hypothetical protein
VSAVRRSLSSAGDEWVIDDAWPAAEAMELWKQSDGDENFGVAARRELTPDVLPRLIVSLEAVDTLRSFHQSAPELITLPPVVEIDVADREAALTEIVAALEAAA